MDGRSEGSSSGEHDGTWKQSCSVECEHTATVFGSHWTCCGVTVKTVPCPVSGFSTSQLEAASADSDLINLGRSTTDSPWDNHVYVYQTQRWFPIIGWGVRRLPTDLPEWSDESRHETKLDPMLPPSGYAWSGAWVVDVDDTTTGNEAEMGWEYSTDWWWKYHSKQKAADCVRKRRWKREYHLDYSRTIELNAADSIELANGVITAAGTAHQLVPYLGWRLTRLGSDDVSQASAAYTIRNPVAVVVEPVPVDRLHFLQDVSFMTRCSYVSPTGEKLRGVLSIGPEQASFVSHPFTTYNVIDYRNCRKIRVYSQQRLRRVGIVKFAEAGGSDVKFILRSVDRPHETFCQLKKAASRFTNVLGGSEGCVSAGSSFPADGHDKGLVTVARLSSRVSNTSSSPRANGIRNQSSTALAETSSKQEPGAGSLTPRCLALGLTPRNAAARTAAAVVAHSNSSSAGSSPPTPPAGPTAALTSTPVTTPRARDRLDVNDVAKLFTRTETEQHFNSEASLLDKVLIEQMLPTKSLDVAWDSLFSDSSDFLTAYHTTRGDYTGQKDKPQPCTMPPWGPVSVASADVDVGYRVTEYIVPVSTAFVKQHTLQVERQRYVRGENLFIVRFSSQTPNMIAGDCFRIEAAVIVTQTPVGCVMKVVGDATFLKSTWLKSKITSTAAKEMATAYTLFAKTAADRLASTPTSTATPRGRRLTRSTTPIAEMMSPLPDLRVESERRVEAGAVQELGSFAMPSLIALVCVVFVVVYAAASILSIDLMSSALGDFAAVSSSIAQSPCLPGSDICEPPDANVSLQLLLNASSASTSAVSTALANARFAVVAMLGLYFITALPLLYLSSKRLRP
ncbi:Tectonin beta-propeller repeat-containing protein [Diplonema papillatum]|nr:Tectonin beta-propeller repeat-containing protein [Diplonema papillatum]